MLATRVSAVAAVAMVLGGCRDGELARGKGLFDAFPAQLEYGPVALGRERVLELTLTNSSRVPYRLREISASVPNVAVLDFKAGTLTSGESRRILVRFAPALEGKVSGALAITTDDGAEVSVPLDGRGVRALAEVTPQAIDFGRVDIDVVKMEHVRLSNPTEVEAPVRLSIEGQDADQFFSSVAGTELILQPGQEMEVPIAFRPVRIGAASAQLSVERCSGCAPVTVALAGEGLLGNLNVFPTRVDFARVALGTVVSRTVTISNDGNEQVIIKGIDLRGNAAGVFALSGAPAVPLDAAPFTPIHVEVSFRPKANGPVRATLEIAVVIGNSERTLRLPVLGEGAASCVRVLPAEINFRTVPQGMSATRNADVVNLCRYDVTVLEATAMSMVNGVFSVAEEPAGMVVPAGRSAPIKVTYTPSPGTTRAEGRLSVRLAEQNAISNAEVKLSGASGTFGTCEWRLAPDAVEFGAVPVGAVVTLGVALENVGTEQCFVGALQLGSGTDPQFTAVPASSQLLDPGERLVLPVSFRPGSVGQFAGSVEAWVNHPTDDRPVATLRGQGVQGCFALQPTSLDYGWNSLSCGPKTLDVMGFNNCSAPVTISQAWVDSPATSEYALTTGPNLPVQLQPGGRAGFSITYTPVDPGTDTGALRVTADGILYTAGLSGIGVNQRTRWDTFMQDPQAKVDVLFVIDNSGSMMEEQHNLGQNFAAFLSSAQSQMVDYHIGVTTTGIDPSTGGWSACPGGANGGEAGRLFPVSGVSPRVITRATPDAAQHFATNVNVGWCHWNEQGLEAAYRALSAPLIGSADDPRTPLQGDGNAGFLRPDAKLAIVFVSDEEDASTQPVSFYETFFRALKGDDPTMLSISAIVGPPQLSACPTASSSGTRYISLAHATSGVVESICTADWARSLENLSWSTFGPKRRFRLSEPPLDPAQIRVLVNGAAVSGTWTYDAASRSVVFDEGAVPPPGSLIQITYSLGC